MIDKWSSQDETLLIRLVGAVNSGKTNKEAVYEVFKERTKEAVNRKMSRLNLEFNEISYANIEILRLHGFDENGNYLKEQEYNEKQKSGNGKDGAVKQL